MDISTAISENSTASQMGCWSGPDLSGHTNSTLPPCVPPTKQHLRNILSVLMTIVIAVVMVGIGCAVEIKKVTKHVRKPTGIITGLACQFVIMPILAVVWAKIFAMDDPETLSLLIVGSCPGGTFSNIVAYWVGGDMELSTVMTAVSVIVSMGTLPLLFFIYAQIFDISSVSVPFSMLGITITLIIVPITVGALLRYRFPKAALKILRVFAIIGLIALLVVAAISIYLFHEFWTFHPGQIITAISYPPCGMVFGYLLSSLLSRTAELLRLTHRQRRTVSVETGVQNSQLAITLVQLSGWSLEITGRVIVFPMMYALSQIFWSLTYILLYHTVHFARKGQCPQLQKSGVSTEEGGGKRSKGSVSVTRDNLAFHPTE